MNQRSTVFLIAIFLGYSAATVAENASNPLAAVSNTDARLQYFDLDGPELYDFFVVDGAYMVTPKLKLKYEVHYWDTDISGSSESDWESLHVTPIYFPQSLTGTFGEWKYRTAIGGEWILDLGDEEQGTGTGSDQIAPLAGVSMSRGQTRN